MTFYKLEELEHTHGTVQLLDHTGQLQTKKGLVLVPQPNQHDPNDPLMWSTTKRITALYSVLLLSFLCNFSVTGLGPGFGQLAEDFHVGIGQLTYLISATGLGQAMGCFTCAPLASKFGRRPVWLSCAVIFFACNLWAAAAKSFPSLLLARIFATWAAGTSEPLSFATINDLFFLHERGTQAGVQGMWLSFGASFAPVICGYLIQNAGWRWYHWLVAILAGIDVVLIFLFFPETQYSRDLHKTMDVTHAQNEVSDKSVIPETSEIEVSSLQNSRTVTVGGSSRVYVKKTFLQELKPWSGINKEVSLLGSFIRPWAVWSYPSIVWGVLAFSLNVTCVVVLLSLLPIYLSLPPYNFTTGAQGLANISSVIGVTLGALLCGHSNDFLSHRLAKKNDGIFEPEMRIPVIVFPAIVVPIGLVLFGVGIKNEYHWIIPVLGCGMINFGLPAIPAIISPYIMDSYYPVAMDCLILFNGFKNFVSFGVGFAVIPWIDRNGIVAVFCILAAMMFAVDASFIFLYLYGKRFRALDAQKKILFF